MSMPTSEVVDLATLDEAGFQALYAERIEPLLHQNEAARQATVAAFQRNLTAAIMVGVFAAAVVWLIWRAFWPAMLVGGLLAAFGAALAYTPIAKLQASIKGQVIDVLAKAIGVHFQSGNFSPPAFDRFKALKLTPSHDRSKFEDLFHGERHGCAFDLYEAHLEDERKDKDGDTTYVTVFRGQLMRLSFPKRFNGVTVVRRDAGVFNALRSLGSELKRVGLGDSRFERAFEVYSNDQVEARYLVHPVFMERLIELETTFKGKAVRCGFESGDLLVAVEGGDKFEAGSMFKPLADPERARKMTFDIAQVLRLMDAVLTAEQAPLAARQLRQDGDASS